MYHEKEEYLPMLKFMEEGTLLREGCCIVADNILFPGVPDYRKYVVGDKKYDTTMYDTKICGNNDVVTVSYFKGLKIKPQ